MSFQLTEEQQDYINLAEDFCRKELLPNANNWDKDSFFPIDTFKTAASMGLAGLSVSEKNGGSAINRVTSTLIVEALAYGCVTTTAYLTIHNMVTWILDSFASETLQKKYLPSLLAMDLFSSYCLTEPNSGSDAASLKTTAKKEGSNYIINGSKMFISGAPHSDLYLCMARTGNDGAKGISAILIEKTMPGVSFGEKENKMGWRSQPTSMVYFDNVKVPVENLVGIENEGFKIALSALDRGRINIAACSLGGARFCLDKACQYMQEREQFNKKLSEFQALNFKVANCAIELESAKLLTLKAANSVEKNSASLTLDCAMAKKKATDVGFMVANEAMQLHGGYGYLHDYEIERVFRDLRVHQILEGTNEIMQLIIARKLFS